MYDPLSQMVSHPVCDWFTINTLLNPSENGADELCKLQLIATAKVDALTGCCHIDAAWCGAVQ